MLTTSVVLALLCGCRPLEPAHVLDSVKGIGLDAAFSPDARVVAAADVWGVVRVWDVETGTRLARSEGFAATRRPYCARRLAFSDDGNRLAFAAADGTVQVWDWRGTGEITALAGHPTPPVHIVFGETGRVVAVSGGIEWHQRMPTTQATPTPNPPPSQQPLTVIVWDGRTGEALSRWKNYESGAIFVALSADGKRAGAVCISGSTRATTSTTRSAETFIWDVGSGSLVERRNLLSNFLPLYIALSPDGQHLFTSQPGGIRGKGVLQTVGRSEARYLDMSEAVFTPDGKTLCAIQNITKPTGPNPFYLIGLPIPPPSKPTIRLTQAVAHPGQMRVARNLRTSTRTNPLAWTRDLSSFIDRDLRLWKLP